ncbi:Nn.00g100840.m01.CDS01 [Neocucurbitaria sp. VM-36]
MIEGKNRTCNAGRDDIWGFSSTRDVRLQIYISVSLGLGAFLTFCFLRPRWKGLYAARKKQNDLATALPDLPDSFFGWIIPLWKITDEQVLASAGLDAYVYLAFFKMAIKFLLVTLFFALAVIKPVHDTHQDKEGKKSPLPDDPSDHRIRARSSLMTLAAEYEHYTDYLWMYIVFVYLFTALILYLIVSETRRIIDIRQEYLGSQTTITDRTIRLSGIPIDLRSEEKIKEFIEDLEIGKVESVTLCRNWKELDDRVVQRHSILRKLEEAWTVHLGTSRVERSLETLPVVQPRPPQPENHGRGDSEASHLLSDVDRDPDYIIPYAQQRPIAKIWYGRFKLRYKNVDAIDYYEEKLRRIDDEIRILRKKDFQPTPLAFVTMDSVASAQMAIQAVLDPSPLQLLANNSPAPSDVVWSNTYLSRTQRLFRSWSITVIIGILSIFWTVLLVPIAGALNTCSIHEVFPGLADALDSHAILQSLVNTQLPTLALTLINVAVPFLYDWMANKQGMISQGDVELSVISKNFFFTFFNFFILFTILGTASGLLDMLERFGEKLTSATQIAYALAKSLSDLLGFYTNFIILQGFGLFPFRLMEFGALSLYPIYLIGAKTPRDYAELVQPPVFSYGFFLPQTILIFIICMVYSVLKDSWQVLLTGLAYFMIGHFVHKYQLLYAMEHRQHSTGRGWTMMCDRVIVGVVLFQITVAGQLALKKAFKRALIIAPLVIGTLWFLYVFSRTYRPLMKFIALRSLRNPEQSDLGRDVQEEAVSSGREGRIVPAGRLTLDEARESGQRFVNPSLVMPLNEVWLLNKHARLQGGSNGVDSASGAWE